MRLEEIMEKVKRKEEEKARIDRCLNVRICPKCGEDMFVGVYDDGTDLVCPKCSVRYHK